MEALIITLSIFLLGIFLGYYISDFRIKEMFSTYDEIKNKISGAILQAKILEGEICNYDVLKEMGKEKLELGREVAMLENLRGKNDVYVLRLKEEYELLLINHLLLIQTWKEKCGKNVTIIIFFYSNRENVTESENQGFVLDHIYEKYPEKVTIYAFDFDIENPAIAALKKKYGITFVPTLVINEKVYPGFQDMEKIKKLI